MVRTIDNLGADVSENYAKRSEQEDLKLVKDSRTVSVQTTIDTTNPVFTNQLDVLFPITHHTWSLFFPPENYNEQANRLFVTNVVPAFGDEEQKQAYKQRIEDSKALLDQTTYEYPWQKTQEEEDWNREKETFTSLLDCLSTFDKYITEIKSRCGELYKG